MKITKLASVLTLVSAVTLSFSCNSNRTQENSNNIISEAGAEDNGLIVDDFRILISNDSISVTQVYSQNYDNDKQFCGDGFFALIDKNGEYVKYNPNEDYSVYASPLCFVRRVLEKYLDDKKFNLVTEYSIDQLPELTTYRKQVYYGVEKFLLESPDSIDNTQLRQIITMQYDECKPQTWTFHLDSISARIKKYENDKQSNFSSLTATSHSEFINSHINNTAQSIINADGEKLPDDALILIVF
ncbi:MAG: hypothetical protein K2G64_06980 [Muribaculaceae bacterium]|nr:hypothetical protein [Muribaculaceae bacterium]MDE5968832.1 hypothetical protein [Muribaculaceae bacterium]